MMETRKFITDFIGRYRAYVICAIAIWFVITSMIAYEILSSLEDMNMMMCFWYAKAKIRSWFFFLPDNWLSGIKIKAGVGHFKRIIAIWISVFSEEGWKLYLYIFNTFAVSFLICGSAVYKYYQRQIKKFRDGITITGKLLPLDEFQEKYPEAFGDYLTFAGLNLSEQIFKTPFYVWGNDEAINKTLKQFLEDVRAKKKKAIIFEKGNTLHKNLSVEDDILFDISGEKGLSWNFTQDLQQNKDVIINEIINTVGLRDKLDEIQILIAYLADLSTEEFFQTLCFAPFKYVKSELGLVANIEDNQEAFIKIRNQIADKLYCFKNLTAKSKKISIHEFLISDKSVLWIPYVDKIMIQFIEKVIDSSIIKITLGEKIIKNVKNTIVINHSLENSRKLLRYNKLLLSPTQDTKRLIYLFGDTTTEYPSFFKKRYKNEINPILSDSDIASGNFFFKYKNEDDVLRLHT